MVWTLEQIADEYKKIVNQFIGARTKFKINKKTLEIYSHTTKNLETIYHLFYKRTLEELKQQKIDIENLKKESFINFSKTESIDKTILHHLIIIQDKISQISFLFA